jgi:hypothetical protein
MKATVRHQKSVHVVLDGVDVMLDDERRLVENVHAECRMALALKNNKTINFYFL